MRRLSKKKVGLIIIIVVAALFLSAVVYYFPMIRMMYYTSTEYKHFGYVGNFDEMQEDYQRVADLVIDDHERTSLTEYLTLKDVDKMMLLKGDEFEDLELNEVEDQSLRKIYETIGDNGEELRFIKVEDDKIIFMTSHHDYAIVYAQDGKKPKNITNEDKKGTRYHIKDLGDGWYTVSSAPPLFT